MIEKKSNFSGGNYFGLDRPQYFILQFKDVFTFLFEKTSPLSSEEEHNRDYFPLHRKMLSSQQR